MYPILNRYILLMLGSLLFIYSVKSHSLSEDRFKKVHIVADSGIYNYKTGINVYEGNVRIDQGTTHVTADKLITKNNHEHSIQEAIAYGKEHLAHYWTVPKIGDPEMHAKAKIIKFYPIESNVSLEKDVIVSQGKNEFKGNLIHYNSQEQTIIVPKAEQGQALLIYNPK